MYDFRMKLQGMYSAIGTAHSRYFRILRPACCCEFPREFFYVIPVAHPYHGLFFNAAEDFFVSIRIKERLAVFAAFPGSHLASETFCKQLHAVTYAKYTELAEYSFIKINAAVKVHMPRTAGEDNSLYTLRFQHSGSNGAGKNFAVNSQLPDSAGNQLCVLGTEINYRNHVLSFFFKMLTGRPLYYPKKLL